MAITSISAMPQEDVATRAKAMGTPNALARAAVTESCFTFLGVLEVCWKITGQGIKITVTLKVPIIGEIEVGECTLDLDHPECEFGIEHSLVTATVKLGFDFDKGCLKVGGKACLFQQCVEGETEFCL